MIFKHWDCVIERQTYYNGRTALVLNEKATGERIAVATINVQEEIYDNEVVIKDYSENEGMLDALISAGIVKDTGKRIKSGFVKAPVCELL